jgi:hypothetical protein
MLVFSPAAPEHPKAPKGPIRLDCSPTGNPSDNQVNKGLFNVYYQ